MSAGPDPLRAPRRNRSRPPLLADALAAALDRAATGTLAQQLGEQLRRLIADGRLRPGQRLPASRQLAAELQLGRNTVIEAYNRLADQGYLDTRTGAGCFVADPVPPYEMPAAAPMSPPAPATGTGPRPGATGLSRRGAAVLREPGIAQGGAFAPCVPDLQHFPHRHWQRLVAQVWRGSRASDLGYAGRGGDPQLRRLIAEHVQLTRQVRCTPEQVLIVDGAQQGLDLVARFAADPGALAWVEDPGYPGARRAFAAAGLRMCPIPVDAQGLAPQDSDWHEPPQLVYVTPSHQFPLGVEMDVARRRALLAAAARHGSWIVEDDYDGEFRLSGAPVPSLQGLDTADRVIYVGTFSKVLFPALRLGYLVLPPALAEPFVGASARLLLQGRQPEQRALAAFIGEGLFAAHIRRMRQVYAERRDRLAQVWQRELGEAAPLLGTTTGMHLSVPLPMAIDDRALGAQAAAQGIVAQALSHFSALDRCRGLVLGYGAAHERAIDAQGAALARLVADTLTAQR
ncbi:PLP-dependent aminotransferase family protein [Aquabacterium humicola]|uniref:MocR-like pyridoxine biosynthesis transcription factor PdxR n=1 Tax=Aquabacterium humicola TaxID=3237377 RepID=UPI002542A19E|nr:PLP-dependent aminotransferase family protein [Rubrivivax pictus]